MYKTYVLAEDFVRLEIKVNELDDVNADLNAELHIKNKIIENLTKVIKSQEEEIAELKKEEYLDKKRRAWHY
jgi:peptidoglycan hydrolase CwlO-like protein